MQKTLIIVADKSRARLFSVDTPKGPLRELEDFVSPRARLHGNQRHTDGKSRRHTKEHEHHTFPPPEPDQYPEAVEFAGDLARRIDDGRQQGEFERLILVASPDFLGTLRKKLSPPAAKLVARSFDSNLTHLSATEIREHLPEIL